MYVNITGNLDSEPVATTEKFRAGMLRFNESFYELTSPHDIKTMVANNSEMRIIYIEFSYTQLGKDEKWFKNVCVTVANDPVKIKREIFLKRIRGSSQSPFTQEDLETINNLGKEPVYNLYLLNLFLVTIYEKLDPVIPYIISVDCATGSGTDSTAFTIINPYTIKPVGEFKSPYISTEQIKKLLLILVVKHIPNAIVAIERNHVGSSVIEGLKMSRIMPNLYFDNSKIFTPDVDEKLDAEGYLKNEAAKRQTYGVYTSTKTRPIMFDILFERVRNNKSDFITKNIIDDLNNLVRSATGKIAAANGKHDDSIMSYLIGLYVLFNGTNLERYGFHRGDKQSVAKREKSQEELLEELMDTMTPELQENFQEWYSSINAEGSIIEQMRIQEKKVTARPKKQILHGGDVIVEDVEYDAECDTVFEAEDDGELDDLMNFLNS